MPIHNMNFESGVFFARQVGYVDDVDARMWGNALKNYAQNADLPVVAVVDMREVDRLVPTVTRVFSGLLSAPNLAGIAIVAGELMGSRNARVLSKLCELENVRVFSTIDEARAFARMQVKPVFGFSPGNMQFRLAAV
ncbi:MAG: hypothetical protein ACOCXZ_03125 [Chloroflexota bacterium]